MSNECEECNKKTARIMELEEELKRLRQACYATDRLSQTEMALELVSLRAIVARLDDDGLAAPYRQQIRYRDGAESEPTITIQCDIDGYRRRVKGERHE